MLPTTRSLIRLQNKHWDNLTLAQANRLRECIHSLERSIEDRLFAEVERSSRVKSIQYHFGGNKALVENGHGGEWINIYGKNHFITY